ncbi:MAG TPA: aldo/keto reductase [Kofleriaceae bacterium]|nr:aldo/keto reductase [Kofleriaceae bacterium]
MNRREFIQLTAAAAALLSTRAYGADKKKMTIHTRPIPRTKEELPVVGLGTWQTFDVGAGADVRKPIDDVLRTFLDAGCRLIDSSPMYGKAEEVTGDELDAIGAIGKPFLATKVWTSGKQAGIDAMQRSMKRMRAKRMDLMQVHNLLDYKTHLPVLRDWKDAGTIRYLGVTHYQHDQFDLIEKLMKNEKLDFIQIPYSIVDRKAEARILPAAADTGTAVLVMTPFESGALFRQVKGKPLPAIAKDIDCTSWAQYFLKFIIGHPAVTCPIPATSNPKHIADNVLAAVGRIPDEAQRKDMAAHLV